MDKFQHLKSGKKTTFDPNEQLATALSGVLEMWKMQFPDEHDTDILQTALQLGAKVKAAQTHVTDFRSFSPSSLPQTNHRSSLPTTTAVDLVED